MGFLERNKDILASIEFQLARSLPVFNNGKEILFFYKVVEENKDEYIIDEIRYVVIRDIEGGWIQKECAESYIPNDILKNIIHSKNQHSMSVESELEAEDSYIENYERLFDKIFKNKKSTANEQIMASMFNKLMTGTHLKELYLYLGTDLFKTINVMQ